MPRSNSVELAFITCYMLYSLGKVCFLYVELQVACES